MRHAILFTVTATLAFVTRANDLDISEEIRRDLHFGLLPRVGPTNLQIFSGALGGAEAPAVCLCHRVTNNLLENPALTYSGSCRFCRFQTRGTRTGPFLWMATPLPTFKVPLTALAIIRRTNAPTSATAEKGISRSMIATSRIVSISSQFSSYFISFGDLITD